MIDELDRELARLRAKSAEWEQEADAHRLALEDHRRSIPRLLGMTDDEYSAHRLALWRLR